MYTSLEGKKILFANVPSDGHFNPLTGLAIYLKELGCDVRWYASQTYDAKLKQFGIERYPLKKALDISSNNISEIFPQREKIKSLIARLKFDLINGFILRGPEYFEDIRDIYNEFPFDLMVADCMFTGTPFVKELLLVPVISIGVLPLFETSKDLPPQGLGMEPSYQWFGKIKQAVLRYVSKHLLFCGPDQVFHEIFNKYGMKKSTEMMFDVLVHAPDLYLQSGTPGFEFKRSDLGRNIRFIGSLLPYKKANEAPTWYDARLKQYHKVVLVTQGTVEKDVNKIIVPTLEAFKGTDVLVIATTGGSQTEMLRNKYSQPNLIIEDFIPFTDVMPFADVYITNGGYGGVMLGIEHRLPLVVAGVHEGKNEIAARVGYFKLGVNLKTETPDAEQIRKAVDEVFINPVYFENITALGIEFKQYQPQKLFAGYVQQLIGKNSNEVSIEVANVYKHKRSA